MQKYHYLGLILCEILMEGYQRERVLYFEEWENSFKDLVMMNNLVNRVLLAQFLQRYLQRVETQFLDKILIEYYFQMMLDQVAKKSYLGLALQKVIEDLELTHKRHKIFETFRESFQEKYNTLIKNNKTTWRVQGHLLECFQFPIGNRDELQYYQAMGSMQINYSNRDFCYEIDGGSATLLQGFSKDFRANNHRPRKASRSFWRRSKSGQPQKRRKKCT